MNFAHIVTGEGTVAVPPAQSFSRRLRSIIRTAMRAMLLLMLLVVCAGLLDSPVIYRWTASMIVVGLLVSLTALAWRITVTFRPLLLTPLPVFVGFSAITFGFGPLIYFFGPEAAISHLQSRWQLTEIALFKVQVLNLIGLYFTFAGVVLAMNWTTRWQQRPLPGIGTAILKRMPDNQLFRASLLFLTIAIVIRGSDWLLDADFLVMLPGSLAIIGRAGWVAILMGALLAGRRGGAAWILVVLPVVIETVAGALALDNFDMLMPTLLVFVGLYISGRGLPLLIIGAVIVVALYIFARPIVDVGRAEVWSQNKTTAADFIADVIRGDSELDLAKREERADWWRRLDYTPIQAALMKEFDAGRPGETYLQMPWLFVPRALAPDKPIFDYGAQVTVLLFGFDTSSTGTTIFGEAYWNGGWILVVFSALVFGGLITTVSYTCLWLFSQSSVLAWPIGLLGILFGALVRNFFTVGVVGGAVVFFALVVLFMLLRKLNFSKP